MYQQPGASNQPTYAAYPPLPPNATYQPHSIYQQPIPVPGAQPVAQGAVVPVAVPPTASSQPTAMPQAVVAVPPAAAYPQAPPQHLSPIFVCIPETNVVTDQGKPFVTYTIQFRMGPDHNTIFSFTKRYSELLTMHETLVHKYNLPLPSFPPKRWFGDQTTVAFREERTRELLAYFTHAVKIPALLVNCAFHEMTGMDKHAARACTEAGDAMVAAAAMEEERKRQAKIQYEQQSLAEAQEAQNFHRRPYVQVSVGGAIYFSPPMLVLPHPIVLQFKENLWNHSQAVIKGPCDHQWFQVSRAHVGWWSCAADRQWSIMNMRGEGLLFLEQVLDSTSRKFRIYRVLSQQPGAAGQVMQKMCSVKRTLTGRYVIKMGGPKHQRSSTQTICEGNWGETSFTLKTAIPTGGYLVAARVSKDFFSLSDTYGIEIASNQDLLFFTAIAVVIDKIHHHHHHHHHHDHGHTVSYAGGSGVGMGLGVAVVGVSSHGHHHHHHHGGHSSFSHHGGHHHHHHHGHHHHGHH